MVLLVAMGFVGILAGQAVGQTVYEGVRYQYGRYNEVVYGGNNPSIKSGQYAYLPPVLRTIYAARRMSAPAYPYGSPYMPYGPGTQFFSPYVPGYGTNGANEPLIFTDAVPYEEVGQAGFTVADARNEAYANVPLLQRMRRGPAVAGTVIATNLPEPLVTDPRSKAIPLLSWAKAEHERNPQLYKALLWEAGKYDSEAVSALEKQLSGR